MSFTPPRPLGVHRAYFIETAPDFTDERGQTFHPFEDATHGLAHSEDADGVSRLESKGLIVRSYPNVLRGMHIQHRDAPMYKYVRVTEGSVVGCVLDTSKVRHGDLFKQVTLSAHCPKTGVRSGIHGLFIPPWCAWGYWSGVGGSEVTYRLWGYRKPEAELAIRYDSFTCDWDHMISSEPILSERDRNAKPLSEVDTGW